jgi:acyl carrier protein
MTGHEYLAVVRTVVRQVSERSPDEIGFDTRIADLGIDSVEFAEVVVRIEDVLGIEVPLAQWLRVRTVKEVLEMIERTQTQQAELQAGHSS